MEKVRVRQITILPPKLPINAYHEMDRHSFCDNVGPRLLHDLGGYYFKEHRSFGGRYYRNEFWKARLFSFHHGIYLHCFFIDPESMGKKVKPSRHGIKPRLGDQELLPGINVQGR